MYLLAWMHTYPMNAWCPQRPEERIDSPGAGAVGEYELPCGRAEN